MSAYFTTDNQKLNVRGTDSASTLHTKATDNGTGSYYLAENPRYYEPQRGNTFKFVVTGLTTRFANYKTTGDQTVNSYAFTNADDVIELSVKSTSVPHFTTNKLTINRGNSQMHFAGKSEFGDGKLVVNDYIGAGTKDVLLAWQRLAYDPTTEKVGLASDYKMSAQLYEYTPDYQLVRSWKIYGCWISGISESDYDYDTADNKTLEATIVYDKADIDFSEVTE